MGVRIREEGDNSLGCFFVAGLFLFVVVFTVRWGFFA